MRSPATTAAAACRAARDKSRGDRLGVVQRPATRNEPRGRLGVAQDIHPRRLLLAFAAAGFASSWAIGMVVVAVFHGANVAVGGSTFTAVLDVAFGAAALGFAAGLERGWVQPARAKVETVGNRRVVAASPAPARPLRPGRRRRRDRHERLQADQRHRSFTRARLPGGAQRDRLRTAGSRGRRPAGRDLRRPLVLGPPRDARAGGGAPRSGPRLSRRGDGVRPWARAPHPRVRSLVIGATSSSRARRACWPETTVMAICHGARNGAQCGRRRARRLGTFLDGFLVPSARVIICQRSSAEPHGGGKPVRLRKTRCSVPPRGRPRARR